MSSKKDLLCEGLRRWEYDDEGNECSESEFLSKIYKVIVEQFVGRYSKEEIEADFVEEIAIYPFLKDYINDLSWDDSDVLFEDYMQELARRDD